MEREEMVDQLNEFYNMYNEVNKKIEDKQNEIDILECQKSLYREEISRLEDRIEVYDYKRSRLMDIEYRKIFTSDILMTMLIPCHYCTLMIDQGIVSRENTKDNVRMINNFLSLFLGKEYIGGNAMMIVGKIYEEDKWTWKVIDD